ncbi:MAG: SUMF1/EgtB/PvdO family nonheme iron enzyme, partial [Chromatiales bacterium]
MTATPTTEELVDDLRDARRRTLALVGDLSDEQLMGPRLPIVNPLRWEIGHAAYFQELWTLRHLDGRPPILANADSLYDSMTIEHDVRWDLPLLSREDTLAYMQSVLDAQVARLEGREPSPEEAYLYRYGVFHEDMHTEAFTYTRQTLAYPAPRIGVDHDDPGWSAGPLPGDVEVPGGTFMLGAAPDEPFVFDNEKWAHPVEVAPFRIARAPVTNAELALFVDEGGYRR